MVNDMLTLSKLESSKMVIQLSEFDMLELINEVALEFSMIMKEKNLTCVIDATSNIITSDKIKIHQLLLNLVGNACKFTPKDGTIKISLVMTPIECFISIEDTGVGIKEIDIPKLFSKFYQAKQHLESRQQGTGLGLSICKLILSYLGGKIWVKSEVGK
jgi:signal transduction histidine kinase